MLSSLCATYDVHAIIDHLIAGAHTEFRLRILALFTGHIQERPRQWRAAPGFAKATAGRCQRPLLAGRTKEGEICVQPAGRWRPRHAGTLAAGAVCVSNRHALDVVLSRSYEHNQRLRRSIQDSRCLSGSPGVYCSAKDAPTARIINLNVFLYAAECSSEGVRSGEAERHNNQAIGQATTICLLKGELQLWQVRD